MKIPLLTTLALVLAPLLTAAPRLVVATPDLLPDSQPDVVFDSPVSTNAELGKTLDNTWLEISPALPGKVVFKAPEILRFIPSQAPAIGTTYTFSIAPGHKHLDKTEIPTAKFGTVSSETFRVVASNSPDRWSGTYVAATSEWLIVFNDGVDPAVAAKYVNFYSGDRSKENPLGGQRVAARLERPTLKRAGYYGSAYKLWAERFPGSPEREMEPETPVPNAFVAIPAKPLPVGTEWRLNILKGLPNATGSAVTTEDSAYTVGKVEAFAVEDISPQVIANEGRKIVISFNQPLSESLPVDFLAKCIEIAPRPENLTAKVEGKSIVLTGNLEAAETYTVGFRPPFVSQAGIDLAASKREEVKFERLEPELVLPSENQAQLATGSRTYRIQTVNLASLHIRVKQLAGTDLVRAYQGYRNYTGVGHDFHQIEPTAPLPYSMVAGKTVWEKEIPLGNPIDTSKEITLNWDEILPKGLRSTALFLDIVGTPNPEVGKEGHRNSQALLQLTDIGLAWKLTEKEALLYAFSCSTGKPLPGVKLDFFGEDAATLRSASTDASGLASMPLSAEIRQLYASLADDSYLTAFDSTLDKVGLWHFPVRYNYSKPAEVVREALLFTDRSLYKPGETVRLKGIVRNRRGNAIEAATPGKAQVVILDPTEKEIFTQAVTISDSGSFDATYQLPIGKTGGYVIRLDYPEELKEAQALEEQWEKQEQIMASAQFEIPLRVEEFRRNAFEIEQTVPAPAIGATSVNAELTAKYYQGQPVAGGTVKHFSRIVSTNPYPDRFRDYLFGNHRVDDWGYWYHYFQYRDADSDDESSGQSSQIEGETTLSPEGKATIATEIPQAEFPTSRELTISSEVTDSNNQTLTETTKATVHPAAIYVGVSRVDRLVRAGDAVPLTLVATDTAGEPFPGAVKVTATLTREVNSAVKSRTDSGATTTRNDVQEETVFTSEVTIDPAASAGQGTAFVVTPKATGRHFLTVRGTDPAGHPFATVTYFNVYGTDEYPWAYEDGLRVKMVAEKRSYLPGDTARVLVLSPIEGTALVTVEREKVLRSFLVPLKADNPVIEIPLSADDAPNAFVSVLIVKGAQDSAREHKEPQLRLGYCELIVENQRDRLAIEMTPSGSDGGETLISTTGGKPAPSFRPGEEVTISGTVKLVDGSPANGAEVTLYAEDEGTLAVMGYDTPAPMEKFYEPRRLAVETGTSFATFISEDPESQYFSNKGFFIGGGGDMSKLEERLRKNFDPCATWAPALVTGADGKFTHTFTVPDTLTRYRVIAVAHHGMRRFGSVESAIVVSKDLMLEPKSPRFANQSDTFENRVLVQNASKFEGTWKIDFSTAGGIGTPCVSATGNTSETITLAAGASGTVVFPARADNTGEAVLTWRATPVSMKNQELTPALAHRLSDSVETRFQVEYPMPLLRQAKLINLPKGGKLVSLRDQLDHRLLDGKGQIELEMARSPLVEAAGSVEFLLHYPYGCVEQTTSSLMPWLAVEPLRPFIPAFAKYDDGKVAAAIQSGADRLLSMQLPDGSFTYWQGGKESVHG